MLTDPTAGATALQALQAPAGSAPSAAQAQRFEALLEAPQTYGAPVAAAVPALPERLLHQASEVGQRMRAEVDRPVTLPEDATDVDKLRELMQRNQSFMRVSLEFQYTTKVAELGTRNLQTLYQMQG